VCARGSFGTDVISSSAQLIVPRHYLKLLKCLECDLTRLRVFWLHLALSCLPAFDLFSSGEISLPLLHVVVLWKISNCLNLTSGLLSPTDMALRHSVLRCSLLSDRRLLDTIFRVSCLTTECISRKRGAVSWCQIAVQCL
jgi:hypothetical protein